MIDAMKQPPGPEPRRAGPPDRVRRDSRSIGVNRFTETADSPLVTELDGRAHPRGRPAVEQEQLEPCCATGAPTATPTGSRPRSTVCATVAATRENLVPATIALARAGGHRRRVGRRAPRGVRRVPRAHRRRVGRAPPPSASMVRGARAGPGRGARARPPDPHPRRQARARRPLQRRRADRGGRARRRHGGRLPGHPAHARADRGRGARRGRRRRRPLGPLGLAPSSWSPRPSGSCARPGSTRRSSSAGSSPTPTRRLVAAGVARVYTPKDFRLTEIVAELAELADRAPTRDGCPATAAPAGVGS